MRELELVRWRAIDIFDAEVFYAAAFGLVVDQRTVEVGGVDQGLGIVGRHLVGIQPALKREDLPGVFAVVGLHHGHALQGRIRTIEVRALVDLRILQLELPALHHDLAGQSQRLDGFQLAQAAFGLDVLRYQLICGHGLCDEAGGQCQCRDCGSESHVSILPRGGAPLRNRTAVRVSLWNR